MSTMFPAAPSLPDATPLVSVVVPTRDRVAMLMRAIDSVLAQTCGDFEVIVVDDASSDETLQRLAAHPDPRIRSLPSVAAGGAPRARNRGIAAARGRYVAFLDDDDEWLPHKLERQLEAFARGSSRLGLVHGGSAVIAAASGRVVHTVVPTPGLAVRPADFLGEITFTTSLPTKIRAKQQILAKYARELRAQPRQHAQHWWRLGILLCVAGDRAAGRRAFCASIAARPWQKSAWRDLLTSFAPPERCREVLISRRLEKIDGVLLYY